MAFENTRLSDQVERGARGGPRVNVFIAELANGGEDRNRLWQQTRFEFDISYGISNRAELEEVLGAWVAVFGPHTGFLFKHWADRQIGTVADGAAGKQQIALGDGATTTFQTVRRYEFGALVHERNIYKIDEDDVTFRAWINSTELTKQASPGAGQFDVDLNTGIITTGDTMGGAASGGDGPSGEDVLYGLGYFFVPVRFKAQELDVRSFLENVHDLPRIALIETRDIA